MDRPRRRHGPSLTRTGKGRVWLAIGGWLSIAAALLHVGCIIGGPDWYRFFGAGEAMAVMAEQGSLYPPILTLFIASILAIWALYAFSGATKIRRIPLLRTGLVTISIIYLVRGMVVIPVFLSAHVPATPFNIWSSAIVLVYGITYAVGTWLCWPALAPTDRSDEK